MISIGTLNSRLAAITEHTKSADSTQARMREALSLIAEKAEIYGESDQIADERTAVRDQYAPAIIEARNQIQAIKAEIDEAAEAWLSTEHILSTRPVSEPSPANLNIAKDATAESMARLSMSSELKGMSSNQLHLRAKDAKQNGRHGELYLINLENSARDTAVAGWKPVDLSGLVLPDQQQAKKVFAEATVAALLCDQMAVEAIGGKISALDRLTLGHVSAELEALNDVI